MSHEAWYLGIDLGGTSVKAGVVNERGSILVSHLFDTPYETVGQGGIEDDDTGFIPSAGVRLDEAAHARGDKYRAFMFSLADVLDEKLGDHEVAGIGIAVPGVVQEDLELKLTPNIRIDLETFVDAAVAVFGAVRVVVINDANAAALGESWIGVAQGMSNVLLVTLGTGVGAGMVVNGSVYAGAHGGAGEIGHLCVEPGGAPCNCGSVGCLEQYASARGLVRLYREAGGACRDNDARAVMQAFQEGDLAAVRAVDVFSEKLGFGLAQTANIIDPDVIVLGGGISQSARLFLSQVCRCYSVYALVTCCNTPIVAAQLRNDAGFVGAARQVMGVMAQEASQAPKDRAHLEVPDVGLEPVSEPVRSELESDGLESEGLKRDDLESERSGLERESPESEPETFEPDGADGLGEHAAPELGEHPAPTEPGRSDAPDGSGELAELGEHAARAEEYLLDGADDREEPADEDDSDDVPHGRHVKTTR